MKKILIVDDEVDIANSIQYVLNQEGFGTLLAHDGIKAIQVAESEKPDLIILDLMMPGLDGYEVCRRVRSQDRKTPILMLTARTSEIDTVVGLELGANDYIAKPVRLRELVARVKAHLREAPGTALVRAADGLTSCVIALHGAVNAGVHRPAAPHAFGRHAAVPFLRSAGPVRPGETYAAAVALSGDPAGPGEPPRLATEPGAAGDLAVVVRWADGEQDRLTL